MQTTDIGGGVLGDFGWFYSWSTFNSLGRHMIGKLGFSHNFSVYYILQVSRIQEADKMSWSLSKKGNSLSVHSTRSTISRRVTNSHGGTFGRVRQLSVYGQQH